VYGYWRDNFSGTPLAITQDKETTARSGHPESVGLQNLRLDPVADFPQLINEFTIPGPPTHTHNVLYHNPSRVERPCISGNLEGCRAACFAPGLAALGGAVISAFRGGHNEVYLAKSVGKLVRIMILQIPVDEFGLREVTGIDFAGQLPAVKPRDDFGSG